MIQGFLDFHTEWSASGIVTRQRHTSACYGHSFTVFQGLQTYEIWAFLAEGKQFASRNLCYMTQEQVAEHMCDLERMLPSSVLIEWSVTYEPKSVTRKASDGVTSPAYKITVKIDGPNILHRFALTWIRMCYEIPYSLVILDVQRLKKEGGIYSKLSPINLFTLCGAMYSAENSYYWRSDQSMGHFTKFIRMEDVLKKAASFETLSEIFGESRQDAFKVLFSRDYLLNQDWWISNEGYTERLNSYHSVNLKVFMSDAQDENMFNEIQNYQNNNYEKNFKSVRCGFWKKLLGVFTR